MDARQDIRPTFCLLSICRKLLPRVVCPSRFLGLNVLAHELLYNATNLAEVEMKVAKSNQ